MHTRVYTNYVINPIFFQNGINIWERMHWSFLVYYYINIYFFILNIIWIWQHKSITGRISVILYEWTSAFQCLVWSIINSPCNGWYINLFYFTKYANKYISSEKICVPWNQPGLFRRSYDILLVNSAVVSFLYLFKTVSTSLFVHLRVVKQK